MIVDAPARQRARPGRGRLVRDAVEQPARRASNTPPTRTCMPIPRTGRYWLYRFMEASGLSYVLRASPLGRRGRSCAASRAPPPSLPPSPARAAPPAPARSGSMRFAAAGSRASPSQRPSTRARRARRQHAVEGHVHLRRLVSAIGIVRLEVPHGQQQLGSRAAAAAALAAVDHGSKCPEASSDSRRKRVEHLRQRRAPAAGRVVVQLVARRTSAMRAVSQPRLHLRPSHRQQSRHGCRCGARPATSAATAGCST